MYIFVQSICSHIEGNLAISSEKYGDSPAAECRCGTTMSRFDQVGLGWGRYIYARLGERRIVSVYLSYGSGQLSSFGLAGFSKHNGGDAAPPRRCVILGKVEDIVTLLGNVLLLNPCSGDEHQVSLPNKALIWS